MDRNTELLLAKAGQATRWEDEEKATNNLDVLRDEFRRRLYVDGAQPPSEQVAPADSEKEESQNS